MEIDIVAVGLDRVGRQRLGGRAAQHLAGADVEAGLVQGALDRAALDPAIGEECQRVGADAVGCPDRVPRSEQRDGLAVDLDGVDTAIGQL